MGTIVISGSASGIGAATHQLLEGQGHRVIGIDLRDAEILADLAETNGRSEAVDRVLDITNRQIDGLVACAGVGPEAPSTGLIVALNYFGAQHVLESLQPAMVARPGAAAVAVSSNSAPLPSSDQDLAEACLRGDEAAAIELANKLSGPQVYGATKLALARWVRRQAPSASWAGLGIRLNAVAPGAVATPLLQRGLDHPLLGSAIRSFPIPMGQFGSPQQIAEAIAFLLGPASSFCCGSVLFADGGTDALLRPDMF